MTTLETVTEILEDLEQLQDYLPINEFEEGWAQGLRQAMEIVHAYKLLTLALTKVQRGGSKCSDY